MKAFSKGKGKGLTALELDVHSICKFLIMLFEDKGLDVSTIKGYRVVISRVFTLFIVLRDLKLKGQ